MAVVYHSFTSVLQKQKNLITFKNSSERRERDFFIPLVQYLTEVFVFYINLSLDTTNLICKYSLINVPMIKDARDVEQSVNNNIK